MSLMTLPVASPASLPVGLPERMCEQLPWESQHFGIRIGRLLGSQLDSERAAQAVRWCRERSIDCLYFLADPSDRQTSESAYAAGFRAVDVRCTYQFELGRFRPAIRSTAVRPLEPGDIPELERIAAVCHADSRFYFDRGFGVARANQMYAAWIRRSCTGWADAVFVAGFSGAAVGYVTCHVLDPDHGSIGILGVDPEVRGRGLGPQLVSAALAYFSQRGVRRVEAVAQGRNIRLQQMYQRCGFVIREAQVWYHLWTALPSQAVSRQ